ncbi:hypothetical protein CK203_078722 [Vitis vinifera]|uniref:Uncharacterized protein n=1 Tax=Vitis vinifera TaxID=29760 RepID=A0A438E6B0_VITVI|nr:hypothetical protein CK203_078722 [Vitis vinifera]
MDPTLRGNSVDPALGLLPNGHQFESPQGHWRCGKNINEHGNHSFCDVPAGQSTGSVRCVGTSGTGQQEPIWLRIIPNNRLKHLLCISIHAYVVF